MTDFMFKNIFFLYGTHVRAPSIDYWVWKSSSWITKMIYFIISSERQYFIDDWLYMYSRQNMFNCNMWYATEALTIQMYDVNFIYELDCQLALIE